MKNIRAAVEPIKRKLNEGKSITPEEVSIIHELARRIPNADTIALFAIAKRRVEQNIEE